MKPIPGIVLLTCFSLFPRSSVGIHKGTPAREGEFPFAVQLQSARERRPDCVLRCGGSIISPNIVITAAHCVRRPERDNCDIDEGEDVAMRVVAGTNQWDATKDFGITSQVRMTKEIIVHEDYSNDTFYPFIINDIAVLVLSHPLTFDQFVTPIQLPARDQEFQGLTQICGWGRTENGTSAKTLLKGETKILPSDECGEQVIDHLLKYITNPERRAVLKQHRDEGESEDDESETSICTTGVGPNQSSSASACTGDSGGPLLCQDTDGRTVLCGIASFIFGKNCAGLGGPQVFTAVSNFREWIQDLVSEFNHTCPSTDFNCGDGVCVPHSAHCNGVVDCTQGTDEINCTPCQKNQFRCTSNPKCIDAAYICDGTNDCRDDGSDELGCGDCKSDQFWCGNDTCIEKSAVCDGVVQCLDGSDEFGCGECIGSEFRCRNGKCINEKALCDGVDSCGDGSDKLNLTCDDKVEGSNKTISRRCHRNLDFASCVLRGCTFNKDSRECVLDSDLVHVRNANKTKDKDKPDGNGDGGNDNGGWLGSQTEEILCGVAIGIMGILLGWLLRHFYTRWAAKRKMERLRRLTTTKPKNQSGQESKSLQVEP